MARRAALGWRLDPAFGNYARTFAPGATTAKVADAVLQALAEGYDADLGQLQAQTARLPSEPCPPRNGPSQNLAGMIDNARSMAATAIHACAYLARPEDANPSARSVDDLADLFGARMTGEIQRLRVNLQRRVFVVFATEIGYVQCEPDTAPPAIYCEAQSADERPALAAAPTPERVQRLHALDYADPGRAPNYSKDYPLDQFDDAALARELLTALHDVYGCLGQPRLKVSTE